MISLVRDLTAFPCDFSTTCSTALGTQRLTPQVLHDDTLSSTLSLLFAWHSLCDVQKEPGEKGCHLKRRKPGYRDILPHKTATSASLYQCFQSTRHACHRVVWVSKRRSLNCLLWSWYLQLHKSYIPSLSASLFLKGQAQFLRGELLRQGWECKTQMQLFPCCSTQLFCGSRALMEKYQGPRQANHRLLLVSCSWKCSKQNFSIKHFSTGLPVLNYSLIFSLCSCSSTMSSLFLLLEFE